MNVVFVISSSFPYGEAFSSRARNLIKLLISLNHQVHVIAPRTAGQSVNEHIEDSGYSISYVNDPKNILTLSGFGTAKPYMKALNNFANTEKIDLILSSSMVFVSDKLYEKAKSMNIPYVIEQCEWYDDSIFKGGKWNPYYKEHIRLIKKKNQRASGIIAISRLFEQHYKLQGVPVLRIPSILDIHEIDYRIDCYAKQNITLIFAGSLGKNKENLKPIFQALIKSDMSGRKIHLDIYGASEKQVLANINGDTELMNLVMPYVTIYGRIPQEDVENKIRDADYSIFIRPRRRSSDAGFPTKYAESMAVGTPVITNVTGDIGIFADNEKNGYLISDESVKSITGVLNKISNTSKYEMEIMRRTARKTAETYFDYRNYEFNLSDFLNDLRVRNDV